MSRTWTPTAPGRLFTGATRWWLTVDGTEIELLQGNRVLSGSILKLERVELDAGVIWATVTLFSLDGERYVLDGLPNVDAQKLVRDLLALRDSCWQKNLKPALASLVGWAQDTQAHCKRELDARGWLTHSFTRTLEESRPSGLADLIQFLNAQYLVEKQSPEVHEAVALWKWNLFKLTAGLNARHDKQQQLALAHFFDTVAPKPLTAEQRKAVTCLDHRVLLVAAAGSGKTSTMVAKAGYVLQNSYCPPERMLLLAFNTSAAKELANRLSVRLTPMGIASGGVQCKTFHSLGMEIIGAATGRKPSVARWVGDGKDHAFILELAEELRMHDATFALHWDLFRTVLGPDLTEESDEADADDVVDVHGKPRYRTLRDELVRSPGERHIADWLYYQGVAYEYERDYEHEVADASHSQYRPDFYLTDLGAYLEHWALDAQGRPPKSFKGYLEGMEWKRGVHAKHGTRLLETTRSGIYSGEAWSYLEREIGKLGGVLSRDLTRPTPGRRPLETPRLAGLLRTFMIHAKSNRLTLNALRAQCTEKSLGRLKFRHEVFLSLYEKVAETWEQRLADEKSIDFEDMLNQAADHVENGEWQSPFEFVMVDEFQDSSQSRVRLLKGLLKSSRVRLFAVGDDWQSINRFAGADLSVMTEFKAHFGPTVPLKLQATFRCPQKLCDISGAFVIKNPQQLRKKVRSAVPDREVPVSVVQVPHERAIPHAIAQLLKTVASATSKSGSPPSVLLLGRYKKDVEFAPSAGRLREVDVRFSTVHAAKGQEADHVIVVRMTSEVLGFPSGVADDPVLRIAMPSGETYPFAEERRAFYVALTRARQSVALITIAGRESPFVTELLRDGAVPLRNSEGNAIATRACPSCGDGFVVPREGPYGAFLGCSAYPACAYKEKA